MMAPQASFLAGRYCVPQLQFSIERWAATQSLYFDNNSFLLEESKVFLNDFNQVANYLVHGIVGHYNIRNLWQLEIVWISVNTVLSEMELLFGIVWELPRMYTEFVFQRATLKLLCLRQNALTGMRVVMYSILWFIRMPSWTRWKVMTPRHDSEVASFIHSVHRKPVIPFTIIHLNIVVFVKMAFSVILDTVSSWVSTLHLFSGF